MVPPPGVRCWGIVSRGAEAAQGVGRVGALRRANQDALTSTTSGESMPPIGHRVRPVDAIPGGVSGKRSDGILGPSQARRASIPKVDLTLNYGQVAGHGRQGFA